MIIVSRDGSGDFTTIQEAIHSVTTTHRSPVIILVRMNEYKEQVVVDRDNIRIVGEARDRTIITWGNGTETAQGADGTFVVTGRNVEIENLTVRFESTEKVVAQTAAVIAAGRGQPDVLLQHFIRYSCCCEAPGTVQLHL
jgi:pectinesterase